MAQLAQYKGLGNGTIGNGEDGAGRESLDYRSVETVGIDLHDRVCGNNMTWLYERVRDRVMWANDNHYHFDLYGLWEGINYMQYRLIEGRPPGHYDWHQDFGGGTMARRKLSVIVQLSRPEDYEGCRLILHAEKPFDPNHVNQGDMLVFPGWAPHCVTELTKGERRALVSWVHGPPFR